MDAELKTLIEVAERIEKAVQNFTPMHGTDGRLSYTTEEATKLLGLDDRRKIDEFRRNGLIKAILVGRGYIYPRKELEDFLATYAGYNLSNIDNQTMALAMVRKAKS